MHLPDMTQGRDEPARREVPNYAGRLLWAIWPLTIAAAVLLALRMYCRLTRNRSVWWWDDYLLMASWLTVLVSTALLTEATKFGVGLHYDDMDPAKMPVATLLSYIAGFATILGAAWSKTSFAATLLRIAEGWTRWLVWFIIVSVNVVLGVSGLILWIQCWPIPKLWVYQMEGSCWEKEIVERYQTFTSVYSGTLDIVLAILPWKIIWSLTINKREKLGVLVAMSMGVFAGIVAFLKITSLGDISDTTSTTVNIKIFGTAEPTIAIMAASIPVLRAFIRKNSTSHPQSIQFVQLSRQPRTRPLSSAEKGSGEAFVTNAERSSQTLVEGRDVHLQELGASTRAARAWPG